MNYGKTNLWTTSNTSPSRLQKLKSLMNYPITFIVLVWVFLFLLFYLVTQFV